MLIIGKTVGSFNHVMYLIPFINHFPSALQVNYPKQKEMYNFPNDMNISFKK